MLKIFLSSHGHLASGLKTSLDILMGSSDSVTVFDAYVDENNVEDKINEFYTTVEDDDQVLLMSDLYGGSVNSKMVEFLTRPNTRLVAGVNLALVLELCMRPEISDVELEQIVEQSRSMMRVVTLDVPTSDDEDFF